MQDFKPSSELGMNFEASYSFLNKWKPEGPWILTSLPIDTETYAPNEGNLRYTNTRTFTSETKDDLREWLSQRNGRCGVYFQVNSAIMVDENGSPRTINKKTLKTDIQSIDYLHIDVDPQVGRDLNEERKKAYNILTNPPNGVPKPTCIVFSGGGFQGFWKLEKPIQVNGDVGKCEEAERYNIQLRMLLGGDECHNGDRIMRLPGLQNVPNRRKVEKGRSRQLAELVYFDDEFVYPIDDFMKSPKLQTSTIELDRTEVRVSGEIKRIDNFDDLKDENGDIVTLSSDTIDLIHNGYDPKAVDVNKARNLKKLWDSRSEALFHVVCTLVRKNLAVEVVYSIITDPEHAISESILELKSRSEKYALRQIQRARDFVVAPELDEMNEKHAVILSDHGKCIVASEEFDHVLGRRALKKCVPIEIEKRYANRRMVVGYKADGVTPIHEKLGKWWFEHPHRRSYKGIVMSPEKEIPGYYNLWRGFAHEPKDGDCSLFINHIRDNLCEGNLTNYEYLLNWMAKAVQQPAVSAKTAIVLQGEQGTGKTFFADTFGALFGRHYMLVSNAELLLGRFNEHLQDCIVVFSDEAFYAGNHKHQAAMKSLITGDTFAVEAKYEMPRMARNSLHLILASNSDHVVPADLDERRFFCLNVGNDMKQNSGYFKDIKKQLLGGGYEALLYMLMRRDISKFDITNVPKTDALLQQKVISMPLEQKFIYEFLNDTTGFRETYPTKEFYRFYLEWCEDMRGRGVRHSRSELEICMQRIFGKGKPEKIRLKGDRTTCYNFPTLAQCRKDFDDAFNGPYNWIPIEEESQQACFYEGDEEPF